MRMVDIFIGICAITYTSSVIKGLAQRPFLERGVVMYTANKDHKEDLHSTVHFHKELLMESPGVKMRIDE